METLLISADSEPKSIARNLVKIIKEHSEAEMVMVGAEALSQAVNAVIIADKYFAVHLATEKSTLTDRCYSDTYALYNGSLPVLNTSNLTYENTTNKKALNDIMKTGIDQLKIVKHVPINNFWPAIQEIIAEAVGKAMNSEMSPQEALDRAADEVNKLLQN